jgi:hypothetical protein
MQVITYDYCDLLANTDQIATMYLTVFIGGLTAFVFCSYWAYHYVDLEDDTYDGDDYDVNNLHGTSSIEYPGILGSFAGQEPSTSIGYGQRFPSSRRSDTFGQAPYRKNSV